MKSCLPCKNDIASRRESHTERRCRATFAVCIHSGMLQPRQTRSGFLLMMSVGQGQVKYRFSRLLEIDPGFHRTEFRTRQIQNSSASSLHSTSILSPNEARNETTLFFGLMEFVRESNLADSAAEEKRRSRSQESQMRRLGPRQYHVGRHSR